MHACVQIYVLDLLAHFIKIIKFIITISLYLRLSQLLINRLNQIWCIFLLSLDSECFATVKAVWKFFERVGFRKCYQKYTFEVV